MIITIEGNPPRKDDHWKILEHRGARSRMVLSKSGTAFRHAVRTAVRQAIKEGQTFPEGPHFAVRIVSYVKQWSKINGCPRRDIDSSISPVFDALQYAGVFDDDMRVEHLHPPERYTDSKNPRITIEVTHWTREERDHHE